MNSINEKHLVKPLTSVAHAAVVLGVSSGLIYKMRLGGMPGIVAIGRSVRVDLDTLLRHVRGQRLRKSKRTGKPMSKNETVLPNQEVVPRFVVRQLILLFQMTHLTNQNMNQICAVLAPELKSRFEPFANIEIKPSFNDLLELIQVAEAGG